MLDKPLEGRRHAMIAQLPRRLGANLGVAVVQQPDERRKQRGRCRGRLLGQLAERPDGMNSGKLLPAFRGEIPEPRRQLGASRGQGELGPLAHPLICVGQQAEQFVGRPLGEAFADQPPHFGHERVGFVGRIDDLVDSPLAGLAPAVDPIAEIQAAVDAEIDVRDAGRPDELM